MVRARRPIRLWRVGPGIRQNAGCKHHARWYIPSRSNYVKLCDAIRTNQSKQTKNKRIRKKDWEGSIVCEADASSTFRECYMRIELLQRHSMSSILPPLTDRKGAIVEMTSSMPSLHLDHLGCISCTSSQQATAINNEAGHWTNDGGFKRIPKHCSNPLLFSPGSTLFRGQDATPQWEL